MTRPGRAKRAGKQGSATLPFGRLGIFAPFEWLLAFRYLGAKRKESFVSVISVLSFVGIMLGVATLIIVMAVMNGFRTELLSHILGFKGHVEIRSGYIPRPMAGYDAMLEQVMKVPGVTHAAPVIEREVYATANGASGGAFLRGMRQNDLRALSTVADSIGDDEQTGTLDDFKGGRAVVIGTRLAQNFGLRVGDKITLIGASGPATPFGTMPQRKAYRVAAIYNVGNTLFDSFIFMPLDQAQLFFKTEDGVDMVEATIAKPDEVGRFISPLRDAVPQGLLVRSWQDTNSSYFDALMTERLVMFIILSLIIVVAALNIISGLIMLVKDKGRDIAVLRTMGTTRGAIMRIFLITGASVGIAGTLAGFVIGIVFCANIETIRQFLIWALGMQVFDPAVYFLARMPAEIDNMEVTSVLLMALTISFLAPLYPAWRAASLDPVEALRYE